MSKASIEADPKPLENQPPSLPFTQHGSIKKNSSDLFNELKPSNANKPTVMVCDPEIHQENITKYVVYILKGSDAEGAFETSRRYSDFLKVRTILSARWPGCYIPPLPPKKINNMERQFIEERRKYLELFCQRVVETHYLYYSNEFQVFLKSPKRDLEQELQKFELIDYQEILKRYNSIFPDLLKKDLNNETVTKIAEFRVTLQKVLEHFVISKESAQKFAQTRKNFLEKMGLFHKTVVVGYENTVFGEYHNKNELGNVFSDSSASMLSENANKILESSNRESVGYLARWIELESDEVEAFLEAFTQRDKYALLKNKSQEKQKSETMALQNVLVGKYSLKSTIFGKTKEDNVITIEQKIRETTQEVENLGLIHDAITFILAYHEIERFKATKLDKYYQLVKFTAQNELKNLNSVYNYWGAIAKNENIKI